MTHRTSLKIFYSWQKDLPSSSNRAFIERAAADAIEHLKSDLSFSFEPVLDRDTLDTAGSPNIVATILSKIDASDIFLADVTIVQADKRPSPNPNVLVELGYAIARLSSERIILVQNLATGRIEDLPFDIRQHRVVPYTKAAGVQTPTSEVRKRLARTLADAFRGIAQLVAASKKTARPNPLRLNLLRELMKRCNYVVLFMIQAAVGNQSHEFANVRSGILAPAAAGITSEHLKPLAKAFANRDVLLADSRMPNGPSDSTWASYLEWFFAQTKDWADQTVAKFGSSSVVGDDVVYLIHLLSERLELIHMVISTVHDDANYLHRSGNLERVAARVLDTAFECLRLSEKDLAAAR